MKKLTIDVPLGVVTGLTFKNKGTARIQLNHYDVYDIIDALYQMQSKDEKFNNAIKTIKTKLSNSNFQLHAQIYISSNEVKFKHIIRKVKPPLK